MDREDGWFKASCSAAMMLGLWVDMRESYVCSGPFEGNMQIKPKETRIWALSVNDQTIILFVHYILIR